MSKKTAPKTPKKPETLTPVARVNKAMRRKPMNAMQAIGQFSDLQAVFVEKVHSDFGAIHKRLTALESRSAPAEEWPKVGDLVVVSRMAERHFPENVGKVMTIGSYNRELEWVNIDGVNWHVNNIRPATSQEIADHKAKKEQRAKEEEWPKVGDYVVLTDPEHPQVGRIDERGEFMDGRYGVTWIDGGKSGEEADEMRPATSAEIASHKAKEEQRAREAEWAKFDVLQEGDACECTPEQKAELIGLARAGGVNKLYDEPAPNLRWERWTDLTGQVLVETVAPKDFSFTHKLNWLPFAEFKRRLQGTIAKRAEEERAKELAKVPEFGNRVEVIGREGELWKVGCDEPTDDGYWRLCPSKCGNLNTMTAKRHEFQIID